MNSYLLLAGLLLPLTLHFYMHSCFSSAFFYAVMTCGWYNFGDDPSKGLTLLSGLSALVLCGWAIKVMVKRDRREKGDVEEKPRLGRTASADSAQRILAETKLTQSVEDTGCALTP